MLITKIELKLLVMLSNAVRRFFRSFLTSQDFTNENGFPLNSSSVPISMISAMISVKAKKRRNLFKAPPACQIPALPLMGVATSQVPGLCPLGCQCI